MLVYRFDILEALKNVGYDTLLLRKKKIFSEATIQSFRNGKVGGAAVIEKLCVLLKMQPGDLISHIDDTNIAEMGGLPSSVYNPEQRKKRTLVKKNTLKKV